MSHNTDEIDLVEIIAKIALVIKNNLIILITAPIIGAGLGMAYYQFTPKVYESQMIITSDILTEANSKSLFDNIQKHINEKQVSSVSKILSLSENQTATIRRIDVTAVVEKDDNLQKNDQTYFTITVKSVDNTIWSDLQTGMIAFIENNDFVKIRVKQKKKLLSSLAFKLDHELADLETLKSKVLDGELASSNKRGLLLLDPSKISSEIIMLSKEKMKYQNELEIANSIQVFEGFNTFENPISPKLLVSLLSGFLLGLLLFFIIIVIRSLRKLVRDQE